MEIIRVTYEHRENRKDPVFQMLIAENEKKREKFIAEVETEKTQTDKIEKLRYMFVNQGYDYDYGRVFGKQKETRTFDINGQTYESFGFTSNNIVLPYLSPTVHLAKLGQCTTYATETSEILKRAGVPCDTKNRMRWVFNKFTGKLEKDFEEFARIFSHRSESRIETRIDIAADIMARDAKALNADVDYSLLGDVYL
jgi:hypothetical protein